MCTLEGTIFDITNILPWIKKHGTNPVTGAPLTSKELIKLNFAKNDDGEMVDPVTFKVFGDNTHIIALGNTGNVFAYDTVERLNIKAKMWRDLVSDVEFSRKDVITLQDPQNIEARNLSSFKYLLDNISILTEEQQKERNDPSRNVNKKALGNAAEIIRIKEDPKPLEKLKSSSVKVQSLVSKTQADAPKITATRSSKPIPYNAAQHTTGKAAASFTSTGLTPHTSNERALLTDEEYMLKPRRVKQKGYARIQTRLGDLNIELLPEFAPRAVWNFVQLAKKGYYRDVIFHRNIRNFMLQGGDPTGTGKGGTSIWGKNFQDEFDGPQTHDGRGVVSMANKGKDTNSSQFFITYRAAKHLDRKHTIFGRVVGGLETLTQLENVEVSDKDKRPLIDIAMADVIVFVDPFDEFQKAQREREGAERAAEAIARSGGRDDDRTTWTGKRVRTAGVAAAGVGVGTQTGAETGVGKYLPSSLSQPGSQGAAVAVEEWEGGEEEYDGRKKQKLKAGAGWGDFSSW